MVKSMDIEPSSLVLEPTLIVQFWASKSVSSWVKIRTISWDFYGDQIILWFLAESAFGKGYYYIIIKYVIPISHIYLYITRIGIKNEMAKLENKYYLICFNITQNWNLRGTGQNMY